MDFKMNLDETPFEATKMGLKKIEVRLNDEKRELIKSGDKIIFENKSGEILNVTVVANRKYKDIEDLVKNEDFQNTGGIYKSISEWIQNIDKYYPRSLQRERGLLAIEIHL